MNSTSPICKAKRKHLLKGTILKLYLEDKNVKVTRQFCLWDPSVPPSMKQTAVAQATGSSKSQQESSRIGKASLSDAYKCYGVDGTFSICNIPPKIMKGFDQKITLENLIA